MVFAMMVITSQNVDGTTGTVVAVMLKKDIVQTVNVTMKMGWVSRVMDCLPKVFH